MGRRILSDTGTSAALPFSNFTVDAEATTAAPTPPSHNVTSSLVSARRGGSFNPVLAIAVSGMVISFFVVGFASGYLRRWIWGYDDETRHSELLRRRHLNRSLRNQTPVTKPQLRGLDPEFVAAIPLVRFKDLQLPPAGEQPGGTCFDCPVCLAAFDATDDLKLLPHCAHAFHSDCIDEWFRSHSTCPLCRLSLAGNSSPTGDARGGHRLVAGDVDAISRLESHADQLPRAGAPTADASAGEELDVTARSILPRNAAAAGEFPSFVPAIRVDVADVKAVSIRRSSSVGTDLQLGRHAGYVVDSEGTQHGHGNFQIIAIDGHGGRGGVSSKVSGLPCSRRCSRTCVWCTRRSFPNLRQIEPVWKSLEGAESESETRDSQSPCIM